MLIKINNKIIRGGHMGGGVYVPYMRYKKIIKIRVNPMIAII